MVLGKCRVTFFCSAKKFNPTYLADATDFDLATQFIQKFQTGLRAGDALHLAIAKNHDTRLSSF